MNLKLFALIFLSVVPISACTHNITVKLDDSSSTKLNITDKDYSYGPYVLEINSKEYLRLKEWLKHNQSGWNKPILIPFDSTIAPIEILNEYFVLKILNSKVYIKHNNNVSSKSISNGEFKYLMDMKPLMRRW